MRSPGEPRIYPRSNFGAHAVRILPGETYTTDQEAMRPSSRCSALASQLASATLGRAWVA